MVQFIATTHTMAPAQNLLFSIQNLAWQLILYLDKARGAVDGILNPKLGRWEPVDSTALLHNLPVMFFLS